MIVSFYKDNDGEELMGTDFLVTESEEDALAMLQALADSDKESYSYTVFEGREWLVTTSDPDDEDCEDCEDHYVLECTNKPDCGGVVLPLGKED